MRNKFALILFLAGALLTMGARWAEKPIESIADIAGEWRGSGRGNYGGSFSVTFVFRPDGSFSWRNVAARGRTDLGQTGPDTMQLTDGKIQWRNRLGDVWTVTWQEHRNGRQRLRGRCPCGGSWQVRRVKKK